MIPNGQTTFNPNPNPANEDSNNTVIQKWMRMMNIAKPQLSLQSLNPTDDAQNVAGQTQETSLNPNEGQNCDNEILETESAKN